MEEECTWHEVPAAVHGQIGSFLDIASLVALAVTEKETNASLTTELRAIREADGVARTVVRFVLWYFEDADDVGDAKDSVSGFDWADFRSALLMSDHRRVERRIAIMALAKIVATLASAYREGQGRTIFMGYPLRAFREDRQVLDVARRLHPDDYHDLIRALLGANADGLEEFEEMLPDLLCEDEKGSAWLNRLTDLGRQRVFWTWIGPTLHERHLRIGDDFIESKMCWKLVAFHLAVGAVGRNTRDNQVPSAALASFVASSPNPRDGPPDLEILERAITMLMSEPSISAETDNLLAALVKFVGHMHPFGGLATYESQLLGVLNRLLAHAEESDEVPTTRKVTFLLAQD